MAAEERDASLRVRNRACENGAAPGRFITFEGGDGCGKSTQAKLLARRLQQQGREVLLLREPGSTALGEKIRGILLDPDNEGMDPRAELLLYEAARAQMVHEVVMPAVQAGKVVICDRFNDSTMAYQGFARGLGRDVVRAADEIATHDLKVDRTILIVRDVDDALEAARGLRGEADRMEREPIEFHRRVCDAFDAIADAEPGRVRRVPMRSNVEDTHAAVCAELCDLFGWTCGEIA